jgi:hypothetical protein
MQGWIKLSLVFADASQCLANGKNVLLKMRARLEKMAEQENQAPRIFLGPVGVCNDGAAEVGLGNFVGSRSARASHGL